MANVKKFHRKIQINRRHHCLPTMFCYSKLERLKKKKTFFARTDALLVDTLISKGDDRVSIAIATHKL